MIPFATCAVVAVACLLVGFLLGVRGERMNWMTTACQSGRYGRTPHHCDGGFYYVVPESEFVSEYQPRERPLFRPQVQEEDWS